MGPGGAAATAGFALLLHCAYAVSKYRDLLKLTQQEFSGLPQHLQLELLISTVLCMIGGLFLAGKLKPITFSKGAPSLDVCSFRPDFVSFSHRGKALPYKFAALS